MSSLVRGFVLKVLACVTMMLAICSAQADIIVVGAGGITTIQAAVSAAESGDTIEVPAGTYAEVFTITKAVNIVGPSTGDKLLIVGMLTINRQDEAATCIENIDFKVDESEPKNILLEGVQNLTIKGCDFNADGRFMEKPGVVAIQLKKVGSGVNAKYPTGIVVENCTFRDGYYVTIQGDIADLLVKDSTITNCKSGINIQYSVGDGLTLVDTAISVVAQGTPNDTYGIRFASATGTANNLHISGGSLNVDAGEFTPDAGVYYAALIIREAAGGDLVLDAGTSLNGEIVNLSNVPLSNGTAYYYAFVDAGFTDQTAGWGKYAFDKVQGAIDAVVSGGTVNVAAGEYDGAVTIAKPLKLRGPNAGVSPNDSEVERNSEAVLKGGTTEGLSAYLKLDSPNVEINGFTFDNLRIDNYNGNAPETIENDTISFNRFVNVVGTAIYLRDGRNSQAVYSSGVTIEDNLIDSPASGGSVDYNAGTGILVMGAEDSVIKDNVVLNAAYNGIQLARCAAMTIEGNVATAAAQPALQIAQWSARTFDISGNVFSTTSGSKAAVRLYGFTYNYQPEFNFVENTIKDSSWGVQIGHGGANQSINDLREADYSFVDNSFENIAVGRLVVFLKEDASEDDMTAMAALFGQVYTAGAVVSALTAADPITYAAVAPEVWVDAAFDAENCDGHIWGFDAFDSVQDGVEAVMAGGTVNVAAGDYDGKVSIGKSVKLLSSDGVAATTIRNSAGTAEGTIQLSSGVSGVQIGDVGHGFTIVGVDLDYPGVEVAAIYIPAATDTKIIGNKIVAAGDYGLLTGGGKVSNLEVTDNEFAGQTFIGDNPAGSGFGSQFDLWNVPRQLVVIQGTTGPVLFERNVISGTAGGLNGEGQPQGNTLVTIDTPDAAINNNLFSGTSALWATALRVGGADTVVNGNIFAGDTPGGIYVRTQAGTTAQINGNSFAGFDEGAAVANQGTALLNATENWWGSANGPAHASNAGGTGAAVGDNVAFSPWLGDGTDTEPETIGFQPNLKPLYYLPASLAFTKQPVGDVGLGEALSVQPVVTVLNSEGETATQFNGDITIALEDNPGSGVLSGTLVVQAVAGVATFDDLAVTVGGGSGFTLKATADEPIVAAISDGFDIVSPAPTLSGIDPIWKAAGDGDGFTLTVTGTGFVPASTVLWNGSARATTFVSATELRAEITAEDIASAGTASVTVFTDVPGGGTTSAIAFAITDSAQATTIWVDAAFDAGSSDGHIWGYDAFASIQAGIDAAEAGGTVNVAAGHYLLEQRIDINKPLALIGPQADVDPRPVAGTTRQAGSEYEAIIDGDGIDTLLRIGADDVVVNGFEFYNGRVDLIDSASSAPVKNNPAVKYNIIHHSTNDEGIQLKNTCGAIIERNYVFDTYGDSINLSYSRSGIIRDNECTDANADGANGAIYVYNDAKSSSSPTSGTGMDILIEGNYVHDVRNYGIYVGASGGQDQAISGGVVRGNVVENSAESAVKIMTCDVVVEANDLSSDDASSKGTLFIDRNVNNIYVTENFIHKDGSGYGVQVGSGAFLPTNIKVYGNSITGTAGMVSMNSNDPASAVDAASNWWGTAVEADVAAGMTGAVYFAPWLGDGTDMDLEKIGFQGNFDSLAYPDFSEIAQQDCAGFHSPSTSMLVNNSLSVDYEIDELRWEPALPEGWTVLSVDTKGNGEASVVDGAIIYTVMPESPVAFAYTVAVAGDAAVTEELGEAFVTINGDSGMVASIAIYRYHSADYQGGTSGGPDRKIDSSEINRLAGYWRAGGYKPQPLGADGFQMATAYLGSGGRHSADYDNTPWKISGEELTRVQTYWRTGGYHVDSEGDDGYAKGSVGIGPRPFSMMALAIAGLEMPPSVSWTMPPGYNPGEELTVTATFVNNTEEPLSSFMWLIDAPSGWQVKSIVGDGTPELGLDGREVVTMAFSLPTVKIDLHVTFIVPLHAIGSAAPTIHAKYEFDSMRNTATLNATAQAIQPRDDDGDGIADAWAAHFGLAGVDPDVDSDGDGHTNYQEYLTGTNPLDAYSVMRMVFVKPTAQGVEVSWSSEKGRVYKLERSVNSFNSFETLRDNVPADESGTNRYIDAEGIKDPCFYRVKLKELQ